MKQAFRTVSTAFLILAIVLGPVPTGASADDSIAKIKKVTSLSADPKEAKEVPYPTQLVQLVTDQSQKPVKKDTSIQPGEAVLTRSANTYVTMDKGLETLLYSDTFVRFDGLNVWLLRHGSVYVVAKRGKLEIVAEALGRILVNSQVYLRTDGSVLLAYVAEGRVVLEANARTLSLGPGQAGRMLMGEGPQEASLTPEEKTEISRDIETAKQVMKGGGGGGLAIAAALAAIAGAAILAGGDKGGGAGGDKGGGAGGNRGGTQGLPDLVPDSGTGACRFDDNGNVLVTVRNQGQADAPPSITRVEFLAQDYPRAARRSERPNALELRTPAVRAGAGSVVTFSSRLLRSLSLRVTVDSSGLVRESNKDNNTAVISCPAPIGNFARRPGP
jgi:hypothetical protein